MPDHGGERPGSDPAAASGDTGLAVSIRALTFWYPGAPSDTPALADVDLSIGDGEVVLLCGPSGSGKSTLLRLCLGLAPQFTGGRLAGEIAVLGQDPTTTPPRQIAAHGVGLLFQNPTEGFVAQRVDAEIAFGLENLAVAPSEIDARIADGLEAVGLTGIERRQTRELSAGQQQRVALAAALALKPRLLLLDEPTAHLDMRAAREVLDLIARVQAETGAALLLSEHRLGLAATFAHRVVVLAGGRKVADGPPRLVFADVTLPSIGVPVPRATQVATALGMAEPLPLTPFELAERVSGHAAGVRTASTAKAGPEPEAPSRSPSPIPTAEADPSPGLRPAFAPGEAPPTHPRIEAERGWPRPAMETSLSVPPVLVFENVCFTYPGERAPALQGVTFALGAGEVVALVGPSGAGKSTLARLALGLLRPSSGRVVLAGLDTTRSPLEVLARQGGLVLQNPLHQLLTESVDTELRLGVRGLPEADASKRVGRMLATFGLEDVRGRHPLALSEGQRRRVALAATLVRRPRVLVLDEPTLGQDERQRQALQDLVRTLAAEGAGVLAISHDPEFVNDACDRVIAIEAGRIAADCPMTDAYIAPQRLADAGVALGDVPAAALALGRRGRAVRARFISDLVAALRS